MTFRSRKAKNEDSAYFDNAKKIIHTMKQKQTADVDVARHTLQLKRYHCCCTECFEGGVIMILDKRET